VSPDRSLLEAERTLRSLITCRSSFGGSITAMLIELQQARSWLRLLFADAAIRIAVRLLAMTIRFWRRSTRATLTLLGIGEQWGKSACRRSDGGEIGSPVRWLTSPSGTGCD